MKKNYLKLKYLPIYFHDEAGSSKAKDGARNDRGHRFNPFIISIKEPSLRFWMDGIPSNGEWTGRRRR